MDRKTSESNDNFKILIFIPKRYTSLLWALLSVCRWWCHYVSCFQCWLQTNSYAESNIVFKAQKMIYACIFHSHVRWRDGPSSRRPKEFRGMTIWCNPLSTYFSVFVPVIIQNLPIGMHYIRLLILDKFTPEMVDVPSAGIWVLVCVQFVTHWILDRLKRRTKSHSSAAMVTQLLKTVASRLLWLWSMTTPILLMAKIQWLWTKNYPTSLTTLTPKTVK